MPPYFFFSGPQPLSARACIALEPTNTAVRPTGCILQQSCINQVVVWIAVTTKRAGSSALSSLIPMECQKQYYRVDRRQIAFVKFVLESYEGVGMMSTADRRSGLVLIRIAPGCEEVIGGIIADLQKTILIESADDVSPP
jgi:hypothetical protein